MQISIKRYNNLLKTIKGVASDKSENINIDKFVQLLYDFGILSILFLSFTGTTVFSFQPFYLYILIFPFFFIKRKLPKKLPWLLASFLLIIIVYKIKIGSINSYAYFVYFTRFVLSFMAVFLIGEKFLKRMLQLVAFLCFISIPLYVMQLVIPSILVTVVGSVSNLLDPIQVEVFREGWCHNVFFYQLTQRQIMRNSGFMWEPSALGVVVVICYILNTYRTKKLLHLYNIGYLLAIITTLSSTALGGISIFYTAYCLLYFKKNILLGLVLFVFLILILLRVATLPIMKEKIEKQYNGIGPQLKRNLEITRGGRIYNTRFTTIVIDFPKLIENPIIGLGPDFAIESSRFSRYSKFDKDWQRIGALMNVLLRGGILGTLMFLYTMYKAAQLYTKDIYLALVFAGMVLVLSISNILSESTFTFSIMMYWFYMREKGKPYKLIRMIYRDSSKIKQLNSLK